MYIINNTADRERYEQALYSNFRYCAAKILVKIAYEGSEPSTHVWQSSYFDNRDIVGNNFSYEASATPNNTFGLGAANIDTLTLDALYSSSRTEILDDVETSEESAGSASNAEFYVEVGYGKNTPYTEDGQIMDTITYVPLGTFVMQDKACKVEEDKYTLKLQSLMTRFDRELPGVFDLSTDTVMANILTTYNLEEPDLLAILEWCCRKCPRTGYFDSTGAYHAANQMELSSKLDRETQQGIAYINTIPNLTGISFNITQETGYLTYRDIIKDIATLCCSFATTDELGNLLIVPFAPMEGLPLRLNDGTENIASVPAVDICTKYSESMGVFRIRQIRCITTKTTYEGSQKVTEEIDYSWPSQFTGSPQYYDITGTKLLTGIVDIANISNIVVNIGHSIGYWDYTPTPFDIETAAADWRLRLGDWACARSNFKDRTGTNFICMGQIMRVSLKLAAKAKYQSFTLPTDNDRNATKRQSAAGGDFPVDSGGEAPPPPEPPVVIFDNCGQWLFGDEDDIREEIEAVGEPGRTYYVSTYGQWSFGNTPL